jgi:hypothetical protein
MKHSERYRITSNSPELDRLEQFYPTVDAAREMAAEYAKEYGVPVDVAEWGYGEWSDMFTVEPSKK